MDIIKNIGLLRRPRYISQRLPSKVLFIQKIPSRLCAGCAVASKQRHHNKQHPGTYCLRALAKVLIGKQSNVKLALLNTYSINNKGLIFSEFITTISLISSVSPKLGKNLWIIFH